MEDGFFALCRNAEKRAAAGWPAGGNASGVVEALDDEGKAISSDNAINTFVQREAALWSRRQEAREKWTFSDDQHRAFADGCVAWKKQGSSAKALLGFVKYAFLVARDSSFSVNERHALWRDNMTRWILSHVSSGDAGAIGIIQFNDLISNPTSALAQELREVLRRGSQGGSSLARLAKHALKGLDVVQINNREHIHTG